MSRRLMVIVCITAILISTVTCLPDAMLSPPDRPNEFRSPGQLRSYLKALNDYYAIVGRPRFGRSAYKQPARNTFQDESMDSE
ncbi:pro-neuropeptide Y-like isoform X2 [Ruditapes philippinarum]|uniref:Neuropeptide Y n=1 Tax=Ruditapes philippinarum TaxID=129788 RepID=A0A1W5MKH7_RUDPH|nr:pro-neuropeptide Y-like isoform X2 [Ruditapes philippinarum]ANZ78568.1 neuropeptide Y [Ruditapes philippinarum]